MKFKKDLATNSYSGRLSKDLVIEVGDKDTPASFRPAFRVKKWEGESEFHLELDTTENGIDGTKKRDDSFERLQWKNTTCEAEFFGLDPDKGLEEGGFEFNVLLKSRPSSNVLTFKFKSKNCVLYKQPPLTQEIGLHGIATATEMEGFDANGKLIVRRPEQFVNSIAVYHSAPPLNILGGKEYKSGKVGHILRPKVIESGGLECYADLDINASGKKITLTIPQSFLDSALYPVVVDPTFGYTTIGGTEVLFNTPGSICHVGSGLLFSPVADYNRITKFTVYGRGDHLHVATYEISGGLPTNRVTAGVEVDLPDINGWADSAAVAQTLTNGKTYGMAEGDASDSYVFFDTGSGNQRSRCLTNLPSTWTSDSVTATLYSWYATYEVVRSNMMMVR